MANTGVWAMACNHDSLIIETVDAFFDGRNYLIKITAG
jgi:hypothetical protein